MVEQSESVCDTFRLGALETHGYTVFPMDQEFRVGEMFYDPDYLVHLKEAPNPLNDHATFEMKILDGQPVSSTSFGQLYNIKAGHLILSVRGKRYPSLVDSFIDTVGDFEPEGQFGSRDIGKMVFTGEQFHGYEKITIEKQARYIKSSPEYYVKMGTNADINSIMVCNLEASQNSTYCSIAEHEGDWEIYININPIDLPRLQMALQMGHQFTQCLSKPKGGT